MLGRFDMLKGLNKKVTDCDCRRMENFIFMSLVLDELQHNAQELCYLHT